MVEQQHHVAEVTVNALACVAGATKSSPLQDDERRGRCRPKLAMLGLLDECDEHAMAGQLADDVAFGKAACRTLREGMERA